MNKKGLALTLALAIGLTSFQGCIGNFVVSRKILNWNQSLSNKYVNELVFILMFIIPVYEVSFVVDFLVLNSLEFWTGKNPLAMQPGEVETKYIAKDGVKYKLEVSRNRYHIIQLEGPHMGDSLDIIYNPDTKTWCLGNGKEIKRMAQFMDNQDVRVFKKDGTSVTISSRLLPEEIKSKIKSEL